MSNLFSLNEKVALVTGATGGIGWAIARAMAKPGGPMCSRKGLQTY
jgi:NAD(P)-dependent dehydrogenase (short-subunit alcohol dehydrogenase family)